MKYKFRAKDLKTGQWVEGDLAYGIRMQETHGIKPMIVIHHIHGGMVWVARRYFVDESTIELIKE